MDLSRTNPVVGPVFVEGAEPGDAIAIEFLDFHLGQWGWTAIIPGFGLLQKDFPDPFVHISAYDRDHVEFTPEIRLPTRPFAGIGYRAVHSAIINTPRRHALPRSALNWCNQIYDGSASIQKRRCHDGGPRSSDPLASLDLGDELESALDVRSMGSALAS